MKLTEKNYILQFIYSHQPNAVFEGVVEDHIRAKHNYKASNVARVCRTLRSEGYILKIPAPHPENGRAVNTYVITDSGRNYIFSQLPQSTQDFLNEWGNNRTEPVINSPQTALF